MEDTPIAAKPLPRAFVIGTPIKHSRSPLLHGHWLQTLGITGRYDAFEVPPGDLGRFFAGLHEGGFVGGNVTIPHKQAVFAQLGRVAAEAQAIGAVNTIWREDGLWVGGNTDSHGFLASMDEQAPGWDAGGGLAVVLGAGGAARAVVHGLLQRGLRVHVANRTGAHAEAVANHFGEPVTGSDRRDLPDWLAQAALLVNTTSMGMDGAPPLDVPIAPLHPAAVVCDIVYVPLHTPLLTEAASRGHRVVDGLGMLLHQAVPGFARWFGVTPRVDDAIRALVIADIERKLQARRDQSSSPGLTR